MRWRRPVGDRRCRDVAERLVIPRPFDLEAFCANIAQQRGRPLLLLPLSGPADPELPCGIWIGLDVADLVFYEAGAADILKIQIVLHEIAHMLLGHVAPGLGPQEATREEERERAAVSRHVEHLLAQAERDGGAPGELDLPVAEIVRAEAARIRAAAARPAAADAELGISADRIVHLLGRTTFASRQERDAETLATLILERASRNEDRSTSDAASDLLSRLNDALGHPGGRR
jgi:hypothetical protein